MRGNKSGDVSQIKLATDQSSPDITLLDDVIKTQKHDYKYRATNLLLNAARGQHEINLT